MKQKLIALALAAFMVLPALATAQNTLTVGSGATQSNVSPCNIYYANRAERVTQTIYPADSLTSLVGQTITKLKWFVQANSYESTVSYDVTLATTETSDYGTAGSPIDMTSGTLVYSGLISATTEDGMVIEFTTPFSYTGGNLVIEFFHTDAEPSLHPNVKFYCENRTTNVSIYKGISATNYYRDKPMAKMEITYGGSVGPRPCNTPASLTATNVGTSEVTLGWSLEGTAPASWRIERTVGTTVDTLTVDAANVTADGENYTYTLGSLAYGTAYSVRVAQPCGDSLSEWTSAATFTTSSVLSNAADLLTFSLDDNALLRGSVNINDVTNSITVPIRYTTTLASLTGSFSISEGATLKVLNEGDYVTVSSMSALLGYVQPGVSASLRVVAEDGVTYTDYTLLFELEACTSVSAISATSTRISITMSWTNPDPSVTDYKVIVSPTRLDAAGLAAATPVAVTDTNTYTADELNRDTKYYLYVASDCGADQGEWVEDSISTRPMTTTASITVAEGPTNQSTSYHPFYGSYTNMRQRSQSVYPESLLTELAGKEIAELHWFLKSMPSSNTTALESKNFQVRLFTTTEDNLTSGFADSTGSVIAYEGGLTFTTAEDGMTVVLDHPFTYTSGNLVVEFYQPGPSDGTLSLTFYALQMSQNCSRYYYTRSSGSQASDMYNKYLPTLEFRYTVAAEACPAVTEIATDTVAEDLAKISWQPTDADYLSGYDVVVTTSKILDFSSFEGTPDYSGTATSYTASGLAASTAYYVYVRANCQANGHDDGNSQWASYSFTTHAGPCTVVRDTVSVALCGSSYAWEVSGENYTASGYYDKVLTSAAGCDSIVTLDLTLKANGSTSLLAALFDNRTGCGSYTSEFTGKVYTESEMVFDTLAGGAANGCDSIQIFTLSITAPATGAVSETACDSYEWNGETYTVSGTYTATLTAASGCDSVVTLTLTVNNSAAVSLTESAEGSYEFNGETLTESGTYTAHLTTVAGCDSVVTLDLTITEEPITPEPVYYTFTLVYDDAMGSVSGDTAGRYEEGTALVLTATANEGYKFTGWSNGVATEMVRIVLTSDTTLTANFEQKEGIDGVDLNLVSVSAQGSRIVVAGATMADVSLYDATGRCLARSNAAEQVVFDAPAAGLYLVRVGELKAMRVVVMQ